MNNKELVAEYLKKYHLEKEFACIDPGELKIQVYKKGEYLFHVGDEVKYLFVILEGTCRITNSSKSGKEMLLDYLRGVDLTGEMEIAAGIRYYHNISAVTQSVILLVPANATLDKLMDYPPFLRMVSRALADKLMRGGGRQVRSSLYDARSRVAKYLYQTMLSKESTTFVISCRETALGIGISDRHLNRIFKELEEMKLISRHRNKIRILDEDALKQVESEMEILELGQGMDPQKCLL